MSKASATLVSMNVDRFNVVGFLVIGHQVVGFDEVAIKKRWG
jgi:hypothetical protein